MAKTAHQSTHDRLKINKQLLRDSFGEEETLLSAAAAHPRGQVEYSRWADLVWKIAAICSLYPNARALIVASIEGCAAELCWDLDRYLGDGVGALTRQGVKEARSQVTTRSLLPHLGTGWHLLLPIVFQKHHLTADACDALARCLAPRVYTLISGSLGLGKRTRLRLEAVSGPLIYSAGE